MVQPGLLVHINKVDKRASLAARDGNSASELVDSHGGLRQESPSPHSSACASLSEGMALGGVEHAGGDNTAVYVVVVEV